MARRFPLQPLFDLAQNQADESSRKLGQLKAKWQNAEDKLRQLKAYREDYRAKLHETIQGGMGATQMRDFHLFLAKLETAISHQTKEVQRCQAKWEEGQVEWLEHRRKLKTYDTLSQRHHKMEQKKEAKIDQRDQDEYARKAFDRKKLSDSKE
jgi:flagellar FliJ protein